jgi:hypothetical protein
MVKKLPPAITGGGDRPPYFSWLEISLICKGYLERQKLRVGEESRISKLEFHALKTRMDLVEVLETDEDGKVTDWKYKDDKVEEAKKFLEEHVWNTFAYQKIRELADSLRNDEKTALKDAMELVRLSAVWNWCKNTKGLGEVAGMTALAFINPEKCTTSGKTKAILGLKPGGVLKKGERAKYNPHAKGRFSLLTRNVIMQSDIYYSEFYRIKKEYYTRRPDIADEIEDEKEWKQSHEKGTGIHKKIDSKARMWVTQLLASHATELIQRELGNEIPKHRNHIPPKPEDPARCLTILDMFREQCIFDLEMIKRRCVEYGIPQLKEEIQAIKTRIRELHEAKERSKEDITSIKGLEKELGEKLELKADKYVRCIDQLRRDRGETIGNF